MVEPNHFNWLARFGPSWPLPCGRKVTIRVDTSVSLLHTLGVTRGNDMKKTTSKAIGYVRVSTHHQVDDGVSLDAQRAKLEGYCNVYDLELVDLVVDAGLSAKSMDRPGLQSALDRLAAGEADALVAVKLDRLTRSVRDLGELVDRSNQESWALVSVGESIDTGTAAGRMVANMLGAVAQWEREAVGERTSAALQHKKAKGEYTGGGVPYGFQKGADGVLVPNKKERKAIRLARRLRKQGLSLRKIGGELLAKGLKPRRAAQWNPKSVRDLVAAAA